MFFNNCFRQRRTLCTPVSGSCAMQAGDFEKPFGFRTAIKWATLGRETGGYCRPRFRVSLVFTKLYSDKKTGN